MEINLSARSVGDQEMLDHIEGCLADAGADPSLIVFEITETAIVEDEGAARRSPSACTPSAASWPWTTSAPATAASPTSSSSRSTT